ncbi:MAG: hypothetical protein JOY65_06330 [Acetobacteraceae bacterium]|nr:hypothetical protein [Acetobacteraceae bacterium]
MRLQHARQAAEGLPAEAPDQQQAKAPIVERVERLRWQAWNGKTEKARLTLKRIRTLMSAFKGRRKVGEPVRKLRRAVGRVDSYLCSQSAWLGSVRARANIPGRRRSVRL